MNPMTRRSALMALCAAVLVMCTNTREPVDPVWGREPCAHCKMLVGDRRFAAQAVNDGDRFFFDDIGCMVLWLDEHGHKPGATWVHDANANRWLDAKTARYEDGKKTPMDFGFEAHSEGGVGWDEMRTQVIAKKDRR
ncbi:MAG: nitrous oxide reductase accessory protein NosL [Polyangiaceae bacterium]|nr:nitrous oxide reductase accessory protein NosL [Polyangiaceae bacterium]